MSNDPTAYVQPVPQPQTVPGQAAVPQGYAPQPGVYPGQPMQYQMPAAPPQPSPLSDVGAFTKLLTPVAVIVAVGFIVCGLVSMITSIVNVTSGHATGAGPYIASSIFGFILSIVQGVMYAAILLALKYLIEKKTAA